MSLSFGRNANKGRGQSKNDDALYLTPFIERNAIAEGRRLAKVTGLGWREISYSGLLTVDKTYDSNMFFWYFPSERNPRTVPLLVYLNGYSTASSYGVFLQNGPYDLNTPKMTKRSASWQKFFHIVYIDNPVGVGFSFTRSPKGYTNDFDSLSNNLYSTLTQFLRLFPELKSHDLYITGLSLAGKHVMSLGSKIHQEMELNLKGIFVGNPILNPQKQINYGNYLRQLSLIDWNQQKNIEEKEKEIASYFEIGNYDKYYDEIEKFILNDNSYIVNVTGVYSVYDYNSPYINPEYFFRYISRPEVRRALHVGTNKFDYGTEAVKRGRDVVVKSVTRKIENIIEDIRILVYAGQMDIVCAYPMLTDVLRSLKWSGSRGYNNTTRKKLYDDDYVWGYLRNYKTLTDVLVKNASHSAVTSQPKYVLDLLLHFTHYQYI